MQNERRFSLVLLFAGITAAYANSLGGPFQFDDYSVIVNRSSVHSFSAWLTDGGIRPVLKLSYMLNWVSGLGTVGFHLFNLGIHSANTFLVYRLCNLIASEWKSADGRSVSNFVAAAAAMAFALHPVQTEAVTYVSGRSTSLMAMFYLASLLTYRKGKKTRSAVYLHFVSPVLFALALMTKEIAITLPFALLLLDAVMDRRDQPQQSMFVHQSVHWILLVVALITLVLHSSYARLIEVSFETRNASENLANQANAIVYLGPSVALAGSPQHRSRSSFRRRMDLCGGGQGCLRWCARGDGHYSGAKAISDGVRHTLVLHSLGPDQLDRAEAGCSQ